jgi:PAS domain S-box-containing protein
LPAEQQTPELKEQLAAEWQRFYQTGEHPSLRQLQEFEIEHPNGARHTIQTLRYPIKTGRGFLLAAAMRDVTEQRRATIELETIRRRLDTALEISQVGVYEHAVPLGPDIFHSGEWTGIMGYDRDELPAGGEFLPWLFDHVHPDDRVRLNKAHTDFVEGRSPTYHVEVRMRHKDGHWVMVRGIARALQRDEQGQVTRLIGVMQDISAIKSAELALKLQQTQLNTILNATGITAFRQDADLRYIWIQNPITVFFTENAVGHTDEQLLPATDVSELVALKRRVLALGQSVRQGITLQHNGQELSFELALEPLRDEQDQVAGLSGVILSQS